MNVSTIKYLLILLILPIFSISQNIAVKSFDHKSKDLDAKVYYPKTDQNGDKCAIIKVVTSEKGFAWEGDGLGIVASEYKVGEYWIYVPYGAKRLTIKHPKLGILRNYPYPLSIKKGKVYEMKLITGKVTTLVEDYVPLMQWVMISTEPEGASVYINDKYKGDTPYMEELELSSYTYRLEMPMYKPSVGKFEINDTINKKELNIKLIPDFSDLSINSIQESGAKVFLDGEDTGEVTPCILTKVPNGEHTISLKSKWYTPIKIKVKVGDEQINKLDLNMSPIFAKLTITSTDSSSIYIDGKYIKNDSVNLRLKEGYHVIEVKKEKYYSQSKKILITAGIDKNLKVLLSPKQGTLKIMSNPFKAKVKLNGKEYGTTPITVSKLLIGNYTLKIEKIDYSTITKHIVITENKTLVIEETLSKGNPEIWNKIAKQLYDEKKYSEAFELYKKSAEQDNTEGQYQVGNMYYLGEGVEMSDSLAMIWYKKSGNQGYVPSLNKLYTSYFFGLGAEEDHKESIKWLKKWGEQNDNEGLNMLGFSYEYGLGVEIDLQEAFKWYMKSAVQEDANGLYNVGYMYAKGKGVAEDKKTASKYYKISAEKGNSSAQYELARFYEYGDAEGKSDGVKNDDKLAVKWYLKSANQGNSEAQNALGFFYRLGFGSIEIDYSKALKWYSKSASKDNANALYGLGVMHKNGYGVTKDLKEAIKLFKKSADLGNTGALGQLGIIYYYGDENVIKDYNQALKWFKKSAEYTMFYNEFLGDIYYFGYGVKIDYKEAEKNYKTSLFNSYSLFRLGMIYYTGKGTTVDYKEAFKWFNKSAEMGYDYSENILGYMYEHGQGVTRSIKDAKYWYNKACDKGYKEACNQLKIL